MRATALLIALALAACGSTSGPPQVSLAPEAVSDGWRTSTPEAQGLDSAKLAEAYAHLAGDPRFEIVRSLLVVRNGHLVAEGYFNGWTRDRRFNIKSATKSVTSLLLGITIDQGRITGPEQKLSDFYPEYLGPEVDPRKREITLENLLLMQAGLEWYENMGWLFNISWDPNWMFASRNTVKYVLGKEMEDRPGGHFHYSTGVSQVLAGVLRKATGRTPFEFAREHLFGPLGITDAEWKAGKDGLSYGGVGLHLTPREMAKIGQLVLQKGVWEGRRLVSESWIETSTRAHTIVDDRWPYGYHWWVHARGFSAQGYGGQYIYVIPDEQLVVVFTAKNNGRSYIDIALVEELIETYVLGAIHAPAAEVRGERG